MTCPRCQKSERTIPVAKAAELYARLRDHLRVVPSWGCYTPARASRLCGDHTAWPLHHWRGPGTFPLVVEFTGRPGDRPTFEQFCKVYNLRLIQ